ncbi:putative tatC-like protein ymf16 (mitochondrion) [Lathyrus oleraceus]|nr:putative tatC-like protein ymf16 [Pisum sativum]
MVKSSINRCKPIHSYYEGFRCARISSYRICLTFLTGVTGMGVRVVGGEGNDNCRGGYYLTSCLPGPREVRIRSVRILIGLGLTWFTRYWFPEELISPLAKPFLTLSLDSYFVCTQSTEASPTYVATSSIACSYFVFPLISHQIWCFLIPSCYGEQRRKYNRFLYLSGSRFSLFLFLTLPRVVPNVWYFLYFVGATSTNSLMIKLQPKIYDHIMLTVRISFIPSVCSQVPVIVICLPEPRGLSVETFTNNRRFLMVFPLLTAALSTPPDIWCQIVARFLISSIIELTIFVASIVQVREEAGRVE